MMQAKHTDHLVAVLPQAEGSSSLCVLSAVQFHRQGAHVMMSRPFVESWHILELAGTGPTNGNYCRLVCRWCKSAKFLESLLKGKIERHCLNFVFLGGQNILLFRQDTASN